MNNKEIRTEHLNTFYVIIADKDNVRKYISKEFPRNFSYTVKINKAQRFNSEELANKFIKNFSDYDKCYLSNPEVRQVHSKLTLL